MFDEHLSDEELEAMALADESADPWGDYEPTDIPDNYLDTQEFADGAAAMADSYQEPDLPKMSSDLTPDQTGVAENLNGPIVVVAGPGAGKTKTLVDRTVNAIRQGASPGRMLIVTFTRKAANEVRERLSAVMGPERSQRLTVTTFHGFAGQVLRNEGHRIGLKPTYDIFSSSEQKTLTRQLIKQYNLPTEPDYLRLFSSVKRNPDLPDTASRKQELLARKEPDAAALFPEYEKEKKRLNRLDYDDMIMLAYQLLQDPAVASTWGSRYVHVQVDEYQDTDRMQHGIIKAVSASAQSIMAVGDLDQSIYAWRGSTPEIFATFSDDFPGTQVMYLNDNFRSSPQILDAVRSTINPIEVPYRSELRANNPEGAAPRIEVAQDQNAEAELVANWIKDLLGKQTPFAEIAVLYRGRRQNLQLQSVLSRARIPVKVSGGVGFYERKTVKDLLAWFRLAVHPDEISFQRVIDQVPGLGPKVAKDILEAANTESDGDIVAYLSTFVDDMIALGKGKQKKVQALHSVVEKIDGLREVLDGSGIAPAMGYALNCVPSETLIRDEISDSDLEDIRETLQDDAAAFAPDTLMPLDDAGLVYHYLHGEGIMGEPDEAAGTVTVHYASLPDDHPGFTYKTTDPAQGDQASVPVAVQVLAPSDDNPLPPPLEFLQQVSLDNQALAEAAGGAIELSTVHAAKGREWDHVAIIGLVDGLFPSGFNDDPDGGLIEPTEEERRVMFVAESRARRSLLLSSYRSQRLKNGGFMRRRPSKFLYELETSGTCQLKAPLPPIGGGRKPVWGGGRMGAW